MARWKIFIKTREHDLKLETRKTWKTIVVIEYKTINKQSSKCPKIDKKKLIIIIKKMKKKLSF